MILDALHQKGYISSPANKNGLTENAAKLSEELLKELFVTA